MSIGKTMYYQGRLDKNCRIIEVNLILSVVAISREFKNSKYYRGLCVIEGRIIEVLLYVCYMLRATMELRAESPFN
jgi:hypothetical protein